MRTKGSGALITVVVLALGAITYTIIAGNSPNLGLDLQGGVSVVLQPVENGEPLTDVENEDLEEAKEIISTRVNAIGVGEPDISVQGSTIVVQLPGIDDQARVLDLVGQTAELRFRPVLSSAAAPTPELLDEIEELRESLGMPEGVTAADVANDEVAKLTEDLPEEGEDPAATTTTTTPEDAEPLNEWGIDIRDPDFQTLGALEPSAGEITAPEDDREDETVTLLGLEPTSDDGAAQRVFTLGPTLLTGETIDDASAGLNQNGQWEVRPVFKEGAEGIDQFNEAALICYNGAPECPAGQDGRGAIAIVLDSTVLTYPNILAANYQRDQIQITGDFDEEKAKDVALALRYGALPLTLEPQTVQTVSATLGSGALDAGLVAGGVGLALVALYVLFYYRLFGLLTAISLGLSGAILWSIIAFFGEQQGLALTLAGIVGIIVAVGVTIDSSIVYFESIKESVRNGKSLRATMDPAYKQAFATIVKADTSSLIAAVVLYVLSVGPVRGFAFYLGLATLIDLVMSYMFMRPAAAMLAKSKFSLNPPLFGIPVKDLGTDAGGSSPVDKPIVKASSKGGES